MDRPREAGRGDDITLVLAFSGGGSRAAALACGVLLELRDTRIGAPSKWSPAGRGGRDQRGLRWQLHRGPSGFLRRDLTGDVLQRILDPLRWVGHEGRSEAAASLYDATIFKDATFADLRRAGGPLIVINATDLEAGTRFAFLQERFDLLCSDLRSDPLANAVAAPSAVPVLFEPMVLENHAGCSPPALPQAADSPQLEEVIEGLKGDADKRQRRYIHLADGGLTGNLGLRAFQETIDLAGGLRALLRRTDCAPTGHVMVISVDASGNVASGLGLDLRAPSMLQAVDVMSESCIATTRRPWNRSTTAWAAGCARSPRHRVRSSRGWSRCPCATSPIPPNAPGSAR